MNERIQELAEQAEKLADDELAHLERVHNRLYSFTEGREIYNQKFAELIVKDCMTMCTELQAQYLTSRKSTMDFDEKNIYAEGESACDILRHKMKKHFGVEE